MSANDDLIQPAAAVETPDDDELFDVAYDLLPRHVERELARIWRRRPSDTDRRALAARDRIVVAYRRLALACAQRTVRPGILLDDLVQEAMIGLVTALDRFDPEMGTGFGTFARFHVMSRLQLYLLETIAPLRIFNTVKTKSLVVRYRRLRAQEEMREGGTLGEEGRERICAAIGITREQLDRFEMAVANTVPLDVGAGNDDAAMERERKLELRAPDDAECAALARIDHRQVLAVIADVVGGLNERERRIIRARHLGDEKVTLEALAAEFGVSRERMRQVEAKALSRLRAALESAGYHSVEDIIRVEESSP